jgi:dipeptidyl-peptidase-4
MLPTGDAVRNLTSGEWQVDGLLAVNSKLNVLYYSSTAVSSIERAIYAVPLAGGASTYLLPREIKGQRTFQTASFSTTGEFFVLNEAGDLPASSLRSTGTE